MMTLRELTEAWMQNRIVEWHDAEGKLCGGMPVAMDRGRGEVGALFQVWGKKPGLLSVRFRFVSTSRFDKIHQEVETDLEPVPSPTSDPLDAELR
jgi:hypothetical protein